MAFFYEEFDSRLIEVIDSVKLMLYKRHPGIFDRLDFDDDSIYLEPLLYSYLLQDEDKWLDSIIYGYENTSKKSITIFTNEKGVSYIPRIGYFHTKRKSSGLNLRKTTNGYTLQDRNGVLVEFDFHPLVYLEHGTELVKTQHPLYENLFRDEREVVVSVEIDNIPSKHNESFNVAYNIIKQQEPEFFQLLQKNLKKVMIYRGQPNSFATIQAHNMIFLNVEERDNEMFFLDHILHEGSHVIFNTLTYRSKRELFTVHFETPFHKIKNNSNEHGGLYGRFHGLFTQSNINSCMEKCLNASVFYGDKKGELIGRFCSNMTRFRLAIEAFDEPALYKEEGLRWFSFFKNRQKRLWKRNQDLIMKYDISGQPYVFSYKVFKAKNDEIKF